MGTLFGIGVVKFFLGMLVSLVKHPVPDSVSENPRLKNPGFTVIVSLYLLLSGLLLILIAIFTHTPM